MMHLDHVASGHFILGRDIFCELNYWPLAVSMPPTKVCPQCKAAVPVRRKTCERCDHVFRSKRKAECILREKAMRAVESDSVNSARKAKDKLHKACVRASETREQTLHRQDQNRMHMASMRVKPWVVLMSPLLRLHHHDIMTIVELLAKWYKM